MLQFLCLIFVGLAVYVVVTVVLWAKLNRVSLHPLTQLMLVLLYRLGRRIGRTAFRSCLVADDEMRGIVARNLRNAMGECDRAEFCIETHRWRRCIHHYFEAAHWLEIAEGYVDDLSFERSFNGRRR